MKQINVGLIGFGTVGKGVVKVLFNNISVIKDRVGTDIKIKKIADLDITTSRGVEVSREVLTTDAKEVINDPEIDIVVELIGGYKPAKEFILNALEKKKHVVTANKALLASEGYEIFKCAEKNQMTVGFEASVGGGIPIIKAIKDYNGPDYISPSFLYQPWVELAELLARITPAKLTKSFSRNWRY